MMVMCNDIVVIEHDGRRSGLSHATLDMEYDNNSSIEQSLVISLSMNHEHKTQNTPSSKTINPQASDNHRLKILFNHVPIHRGGSHRHHQDPVKFLFAFLLCLCLYLYLCLFLRYYYYFYYYYYC